jgi:hypothetical protein
MATSRKSYRPFLLIQFTETHSYTQYGGKSYRPSVLSQFTKRISNTVIPIYHENVPNHDYIYSRPRVSLIIHHHSQINLLRRIVTSSTTVPTFGWSMVPLAGGMSLISAVSSSRSSPQVDENGRNNGRVATKFAGVIRYE